MYFLSPFLLLALAIPSIAPPTGMRRDGDVNAGKTVNNPGVVTTGEFVSPSRHLNSQELIIAVLALDPSFIQIWQRRPNRAHPSHKEHAFGQVCQPQEPRQHTPGTKFTIQPAIKNPNAGHFGSHHESYAGAPQQLGPDGTIFGHIHVVIGDIGALDSPTRTSPAAVKSGVTMDLYRFFLLNCAANHQPVVVPIAEHENLDDCVYVWTIDSSRMS
ncbi:hypothetical protein B0H14DRAFT_2607444 [Mycena olivaceomarginata]|nr:hypothetical protein B0H14DRAFT_2607444 [Mycena olivaceomarginata]